MTTEGDDVLPYVEFFCGRPANIASSFTARCYAERGYATVWRLSVCPSVRPSVRDVQVPSSHTYVGILRK